MNTNHQIIKKEGQRPILLDYYISDPKQPVILFVHGFKGFKDWGHFNLIKQNFVQKGFNFVKFNFSHNGGTMENPIDFPDLESFGNNTFTIEQEDLKSVIDWIESKTQSAPIFIIGHSRGGGAVLLKAAKDDRIKKVVALASVSTFDRWNQEVYNHWKREGVIYLPNTRTGQEMPLYWTLAKDYIENENELNIEKACKSIWQPALIIHGTLDEAVPFSEGELIHNWIKHSQFLKIEKGNHTFGGKHPWEEQELPNDCKIWMNAVIDFFNC